MEKRPSIKKLEAKLTTSTTHFIGFSCVECAPKEEKLETNFDVDELASKCSGVQVKALEHFYRSIILHFKFICKIYLLGNGGKGRVGSHI